MFGGFPFFWVSGVGSISYCLFKIVLGCLVGFVVGPNFVVLLNRVQRPLMLRHWNLFSCFFFFVVLSIPPRVVGKSGYSHCDSGLMSIRLAFSTMTVTCRFGLSA